MPACQCPPPLCQARSRRLPGLVLSGQLFGQLVPPPRSPAAEVEVQSCWLLVASGWKLEDRSSEKTVPLSWYQGIKQTGLNPGYRLHSKSLSQKKNEQNPSPTKQKSETTWATLQIEK